MSVTLGIKTRIVVSSLAAPPGSLMMRSASPNSTPFFSGLRVSPERASGSKVVHRFASGGPARWGEGRACKDAGASEW